MYRANSTIVKKQIWIMQDCISALHLETGTPLHDVRVINVREEPNSLTSLTECSYPGNFLTS